MIHISLPDDLGQKQKDRYLEGHKRPQSDEKLLDLASIPLKDFLDMAEGLRKDFLNLVCELPTNICSFPGTSTISRWQGLKAGLILSPLEDLSKQQLLYCLKTAVRKHSGSWELTAVEREKLPLALLYLMCQPN